MQKHKGVHYHLPVIADEGKYPRVPRPANVCYCYTVVIIMFHLITYNMEEFAVIKSLGKGYQAIVEETFDNVADATAFANIMRRKANGWDYYVFQLNEGL